MATEKIPADTTPIPAAPATSFDLTLDEYCTRLSADKASPEIIGGFYHSQAVSGNTKASSAAFAQAFDAFKKQPA